MAEALDSSRGYFEWPQTYPSETARIPCKEGGAATRVCSITGYWEDPELSNCQVSAAKLFKYLMMVRNTRVECVGVSCVMQCGIELLSRCFNDARYCGFATC